MKKKKLIALTLSSLCLVTAFSTTAFASTDTAITTNVAIEAETASNISPVTPDYISPSQPGVGFTGWCFVTAEPNLVVRSGPSTSYAAIGYLNQYAVVRVENVYSSGWAKIKDSGYVSKEYLSTNVDVR